MYHNIINKRKGKGPLNQLLNKVLTQIGRQVFVRYVDKI